MIPGNFLRDNSFMQHGKTVEQIREELECTVREFKGEETIKEWDDTITEIIVEMGAATDLQGLPICNDFDNLIKEYSFVVGKIKESMNNTSGGMLVPALMELDHAN